MNIAINSSNDLVTNESILKDMGDEDILVDAYEDGSSVICIKCQSLVKRERWNAHSKKWCPFINNNNDDNDDDDDDDDMETE